MADASDSASPLTIEPSILDCLNDDILQLICASLHDQDEAQKQQHIRAHDKVRYITYVNSMYLIIPMGLIGFFGSAFHDLQTPPQVLYTIHLPDVQTCVLWRESLGRRN